MTTPSTILIPSDLDLVRGVLDRMERDGHEVDEVAVTEVEAAAIEREKRKFQYVKRLGHHVELSPWLKVVFGVDRE